jgi:ABC-2 type transport system permease protein
VAKRNIALLALCQASLMTGHVLMFTTAPVIGSVLAPDKSLATTPIAVLLAATLIMVMPAALIMKHIGRDDMTSGMIDRLRSLPIRSFAVIAGHVTASVARNALSTAIVVLAALAMGFRPNASALDWLAAIGLLLLYVVALSWLAAALGVIAKTVESASALSFFMLFVPYLSSAFVQTETMPRFLRPISEHQPITPVIEAVRGFLTGTPLGSNGWIALAWCSGLLVFSSALATVLYRHRATG